MRRTCQPFSFSAAVSFSSDCQPSLAPESQVARPVAPAAPAIRLSAPPMHSLSFTQSSRLFLGIERMAAHDGFLALGPGRAELDRHPVDFLIALQDPAARRRQRAVDLDPTGLFHPALQFT